MGTNLIIGCTVGDSIGSNVNPPANEAEVDTYITGLVTPLSGGQITKLNTLVRALKTGLGITNLSDAFDVLYILAGETAESSLKNLVKNAHHATAVNSPDFTQFEGFKGNGTSSYIDTQYNPFAHGDKYLLDSASFGVYIRQGWVIGTNGLEVSVDLTTGLRTTSPSDSRGRAAINSNDLLGGFLGNFVNTQKDGFFVTTRVVNSNILIYRNKNAINPDSTQVQVSNAIPNSNFKLFSGYEAINYSDSQQSFMFTGRGLSSEEVGSIQDAVEAYMDSNGKGVIE